MISTGLRFRYLRTFVIIFCVLLVIYLLPFSSIQSSEVKAVALEKEALRLEKLASETADGSLRSEYLLIAERRRESARLEREKHFLKAQNPVQDTKEIREVDKTFPTPKNRWMNGVWEVGIGVGNGIMDVSPGGMYIQDPALIAFLQTDFVPRAGIGYDNIFTIDSRQSPRRYAVRPNFFKINYFESGLKYGFGIQERSLRQNVSYNAWDLENPRRRINAVHYGEYEWTETKFNVFYRENWSYDKMLTLVWGLRVQSTNLLEKAALPNFPATYEYSENSYSFAPNLGMGYTQNFFGVVLFTVGAELSVGRGGLSYDQRFLRGGFGDRAPSFTYLEMEKPIPMDVFGGEFYMKYDFILNEKSRLGISWTTHQFFRQTNQRHFPLILSSDPDLLANEYRRVLARTLIYNDESSRPGNQRYQILRFFQLEYTHVF